MEAYTTARSQYVLMPFLKEFSIFGKLEFMGELEKISTKINSDAFTAMSESWKYSPAQWLITFFFFFCIFYFLRFPLKSLLLFLRTKLNFAKYTQFLSFWIADYVTTNIWSIFLF